MYSTQYIKIIFFFVLSICAEAQIDAMASLKHRFAIQRMQKGAKTQMGDLKWHYQAFNTKDAETIAKVLEGKGGEFIFKTTDLSGRSHVSLEEADVLLYDIGLGDYIKKHDPLDREMLVRKAQISESYNELHKKYQTLNSEKLRKLYGLFH